MSDSNKGIFGTVSTWFLWLGAHLAVLNQILQAISFLGAIILTALTIRNLIKHKRANDDDYE